MVHTEHQSTTSDAKEMQVRHALMTLLTLALRKRDGTSARHAGFIKRSTFHEWNRHPQSELWYVDYAVDRTKRPDVEVISEGRTAFDLISIAVA